MGPELIPLAVEQDTAQMEHPLRSASAPSHAWTVESHANEVADRAFDDAGGDVEVVGAKRVVAHPMAVLAEVREDVEQLLALGFVARAGLRDGGVGGRQRGDDLVGSARASQVTDSLGDPRGELVGALTVQTSSSAPQLLDDVDPVDARLGLGERTGLLVPDRFTAIGKEQRAFGAVASLDRLVVEPLEQGGVALEGRVEPLVDRPFATAVGGAAQRVDRADERDLGVLALVTFGAARALSRAPAFASAVTTGARALHARALSQQEFGEIDVWRTTTVDLDDEDLAVVFWCWSAFEKRSRFCTHRVDHAKRRARTRRPFAELRERRARVAERQLGAQPGHRQHRRQAEPAAQTERTIDRTIAPGATASDATADRAFERQLAEPRPDLTAGRSTEHELRTVVHVLGGAWSYSDACEVERDHRATKREQRRPQRGLNIVKRCRGRATGDRARFFEGTLDFAIASVDTGRHGAPCGRDRLGNQISAARRPRTSSQIAQVIGTAPASRRQIGTCTHVRSD